MEKKEALLWVRQNCKFAAGMQNVLAPEQLQAVINSLIVQLSHQPKLPFGQAKQQVTTALQEALAQQGAALQAYPQGVDEIMRALNYPVGKANPMQMGPQGWEDPGLAKMRQQPAPSKMPPLSVKQPAPQPAQAPAQPPQRKNPFAF